MIFLTCHTFIMQFLCLIVSYVGCLSSVVCMCLSIYVPSPQQTFCLLLSFIFRQRFIPFSKILWQMPLLETQKCCHHTNKTQSSHLPYWQRWSWGTIPCWALRSQPCCSLTIQTPSLCILQQARALQYVTESWLSSKEVTLPLQGCNTQSCAPLHTPQTETKVK